MDTFGKKAQNFILTEKERIQRVFKPQYQYFDFSEKVGKSLVYTVSSRLRFHMQAPGPPNNPGHIVIKRIIMVK